MRIRTATARRAASLAALALLLPLAACNDDEPAPSAAPSESTSSSAEESPTESASPSAEEPADDGGSAEGEAAAFLDRLQSGVEGQQSSHVSMRMTGATQLSAVGDTTSDGEGGASARLTMRMAALGNQALRLLLVDGDVYMSIPGATPAGKYFKVPQNSQTGNLTQLTQGLSLEEQFKTFEKGLTSVQDLGEATVDGTQTDKYRMKLDLSAMTSELQGLPQGMAGSLPKTLSYLVWLDGDDHVRRMTYSVAGLDTVMDFTDWGEPVSIEPPAAGDLVKPPPGI